jgi:hypothetical protein
MLCRNPSRIDQAAHFGHSEGEADRRHAPTWSAATEAEEGREAPSETRPLMFSPAELKAKNDEMVKARKAIDDYERIHGYAQSAEHTRLTRKFNQAAESYLLMSSAWSRERSGKTYRRA